MEVKQFKSVQKNWSALQKIYSKSQLDYFLDAIDIPFTSMFLQQVYAAYGAFKDQVRTS